MEKNVGVTSSSGVIVTKERSLITLENPFSLKVGQVFTGFGIGCGIGIGVGRPLNIGAIPMLNQVMVAARGATDVFSGVGRHVNSSLQKIGAKNVEAGIGCGVGFGHGFGVGLALKPRAIHQIQSSLALAMAAVMNKLGISGLPAIQGLVPPSLQSNLSTVVEQSKQNPLASFRQRVNDAASQSIPHETASASNSRRSNASRADTVISNFLQNPVLKDEDGDINEMVMRHQKLIEKLMQENEKLHRIIAEELKVSPDKLRVEGRSKSLCDECFECRTRQRRR